MLIRLCKNDIFKNFTFWKLNQWILPDRILNRTYALILDLFASEEKLETIKKQAADQSKERLRLSDSESQLQNDIETLQKELEEEQKKSRDFEILKKQAKQQSEEYQRMAEEYSKLEKELKRRDGEVDKSK